MAEKVIQSELSNRYAIKKYQFKAFDDQMEHIEKERSALVDAPREPIVQEELFAAPERQPQQYQEPRQEFSTNHAETLLAKIEELSSSLVKMEMQLERQQADFNSRLEEERKRSYDDGYNAAKSEFESAYDVKLQESERGLSASIQKLDEIAGQYGSKIETIEKELAKTAISIAEQVIKKEVSEGSSKIALALVKELLTKLKEASKIKIKANRADATHLKKALSTLSKVTVEEDDAVQKGGIIALSDVGNLDGNIHARLLKIKEDLLGDPN